MAINFPDPSQQTTYVADSGVTYEFIDGVWKATTFAGLGDVRYVNSTGDDMSGNLTIATDKISLNTDGSAEFAGDVKGLMFDTDPAGGGVRSLRSIGGLVQVWRGGLATDNITSEIFADGSAAFSGTITSGGPGIVGGTDLGSFIGYEGNAGFSCGATSSAIRVWTQGNSTPTVDIQGNGSASFANTVTSGSTTRRGQFLGTCPSSVVAASADAFAASYDGDIVVSIKYDGSATFAGTVDANALTVDGAAVDTSAQVDAKIAAIPPTDLSAYDTSAEVTAKVAALETSLTDGAPGALDTLNELAASLGDDSNFAGTVTNSLAGKADLSGATFSGETVVNGGFISQSSGSTPAIYINDVSSGVAVNTIQLKGDGSAQFAGTLSLSGDGIRFTGVFPDGSISFRGSSSVGNPYFLYGEDESANQKVIINKDGSATFAGRLRADALSTSDGVILYTGVKPANRSNNYGFAVTSSVNGDLVAGIAADGSATFADYVTSNEGFYVAQTAAPNGSSIFKSWLGSSTYVDILDNGTASFAGVVVADTGFQSNAYSGRSVGITTTTQGVERALAVEDGSGGYSASLNMDGSAEFAGDVVRGTYAANTNYCALRDGQIEIGKNTTDGNSGLLVGTRYNGGTSYEAFIFKADGSAEFNSYVNVGSNELAGDFNTYINAPIGDDYFIASKAPGSLSTSPILFGVKTDGTAEFAGYVKAATNLICDTTSSSNGLYIGDFTNGNYNATIFGNGSATFAGTIKSTTWPTTGYEIESSGALGLNAAAGTSGNMFALNVGSTQVTSITGQGIATFASEVVAGVRDSQGVFMTSGGGLEGFNGGSRKYSLSSNGSATFADNVSVDKYLTVTNSELSSDARVQIQGDQDVAISVYPVTAGARTIELKHDGSASFNGLVKTGSDNATLATGTWLQNLGGVYTTRPAGSTASAFACFQQGYGYYTASINADGSATFTGQITATNVSDVKFKENIADANPQLADVVALGGMLKNWDWKDEAPLNEELRAKRFLGLVAQEAETICPGIVYDVQLTSEEGKEDESVKTYKAINHDILIMKLLGAVAELSAKVEALEAK
jgi:hypothetical protein